MPWWPMAMPSVTVMVVNSRGVPPPALTPFFTACAWRDSVMLQGAASFQVVTTPTSGCATSFSDSPMAYSMARCGALVGPTVVWRLGSLDLSNFTAAIAILVLKMQLEQEPLITLSNLHFKSIFSIGPIRSADPGFAGFS